MHRETTAGPRKIAVLGGGMAALAAVFELTSQANWQNDYDITVYQMGWRLGGKGASGRNTRKNDRIEEHGLHVWLGFYHHAFSLMRRCYKELNRPADHPLATCAEAFQPRHLLAGMEYLDGKAIPWVVHFPPAPGLPGDAKEAPKLSLWQVLRKVFQFIQDSEKVDRGLLRDTHTPADSEVPAWVATSVAELVGSFKMKIRLGGIAILEMIPLILRWLAGRPRRTSRFQKRAITWLLNRCLAEIHAKVADRLTVDASARRSWIMLDFFMTTLKGLHGEDIANFDDLERLDRYDFRELLEQYGASQYTLDSPVIQGFYNLGFAYADGQKAQPSLAAGVMLRFSLRMFFTYRGAMFWNMQAGMGDVVFAPLYELLRKRGVRFEFFHRVTHLELDEDKTRVNRIQLVREATVKHGEYEPLVDVKGLPCWPHEPCFDQLDEGEALRQGRVNLESDWHQWPPVAELALHHGREFDEVILGISLAALSPCCGELIEANADFAAMVTQLKTVQTVAAQWWLKPDLKALGWDPEIALFDAHYQPMSTWADMTHLIPAESWAPGEIGHIAYFCGVLDEPELPIGERGPEFPSTEHERAQAINRDLEAAIAPFWPQGVDGEQRLNAQLLAGQGRGDGRSLGQFVKANTSRTDRYVLSAKDTTRFRLKADQSGFHNLFLAGDWTDNGLNYGCIEAAVMSGNQAAQAILKSKTH